jgi:hypothetical protein
VTSVALGFRTHLGWAALVALGGSPDDPRVIERQRLTMTDPAVPESAEPYHAARGLDLDEAEGVVHQAREAVRAVTRRELRSLVDTLRAEGHALVGSAILTGKGRMPSGLAQTLASHAMVHVAEGLMFREALREGSEICSLPVCGLLEREAYEQTAAVLRVSPEHLQERVDAFGRELGPPWRQDQKLATVAAWFALASGS